MSPVILPGTNPGTFRVVAQYVGLDATNPIQGNLNGVPDNISGTITEADFKTLLKTAVQSDLETNFGYVFAVGDSVHVFGLG